MLPRTSFIKRHSLNIGLVLMFLYTWPIDLTNSGLLPAQFPFVVTSLLVRDSSSFSC